MAKKLLLLLVVGLFLLPAGALAVVSSPKVAAGGNFTVVLRSDGTLWAWGENNGGQLGNGSTAPRRTPAQIGTDTDWQSVSTGDEFTLAIKSNGTLWAWGSNGNGQLGIGAPDSKAVPTQVGTDTNWQSVVAGGYNAVAVKTDGTLWVWGYYGLGLGDGSSVTSSNVPVKIGSDTNWLKALPGSLHTVALKSNGTLWAWGYNGMGCLGDGSWTNSNVPIQVGSDSDWSSLSVGAYHTLALKNNGTLWAWGSNTAGQLGIGTTDSYKNIPTQIGSDANWQSLTADSSHALAVKNNGTLWAWGNNSIGQLGDGSTLNRNAPVQVGTETDWQGAATSYAHTIALKNDGSVWGWGRNQSGQLGNGVIADKNVPMQLGGDVDWQDVGTGVSFTIARKSDGTLWGWGDNSSGQTGTGAGKGVKFPTQIGADTDWQSISVGNSHTIAMKTDGSLWGWGYDNFGQLGDGTPTSEVTQPKRIGSDSDWESYSAGDSHTVAVKQNGTLWAWGSNEYGRLGDGSTTQRSVPVQIGSATDWQSISAGSNFTVGLKTDGTLWAWGANWAGQLGDGTTVDKHNPTKIGTDRDWQSASAGGNHVLALKNDGTLWAWGAGHNYQLGQGTTDSSTIPIRVGTATNWLRVRAGNAASFVRKTSGTLWTWGANWNGQLGIGTLSSGVERAPIGTSADWQVFSLRNHAAAIKGDGTLWLWGWNIYGQLGDGMAWETSPIQIMSASAPLYRKLTLYRNSVGGKVDIDNGNPVYWNITYGEAAIANGSTVILTAVPDPGSTFTGWTNSGCSGTGTCTVTMDADKNVNAFFSTPSRTLSVDMVGSGSGGVVAEVGSLSWNGNSATGSYGHGTVVPLIATAEAGSAFAFWGGVCAGNGDCLVTMDAAKSVTATFYPVGAPITPTSLTVPSSDADGSYKISWPAAFFPAGVTYTLEEATNETFTAGKRTAYTGPALSAAIAVRPKGYAYYYRVRTNKTGWTSSEWIGGANPCYVGAPLSPTVVTVPATSADGLFTVCWSSSPSPDVDYVLEEATDAAFTSGVRIVVTTKELSANVVVDASDLGTYYYRVRAANSSFIVEATPKAALNPCRTGTPAAPETLTVPATDPDGSYSLAWGVSATAGVTYTVEEATSADFSTGLRVAYTGTAQIVNVTLRGKGLAYYYRVRANKVGWASSAWSPGANPCKVTPAAPATLTVPAYDDDGIFAVSWAAVAAPNIIYEAEWALDAGFATTKGGNYDIASASVNTDTLSALSPGNQVNYYVRVRATKTGFEPSPWKVAAAPCKVGVAAIPGGMIDFPLSDEDGNYTLKWEPSATAGVTYTVEEATNVDFTTGKRTAYTGALTTVAITARPRGQNYYYRVRTNKTGWGSSPWIQHIMCCQVSLLPPGGITVPTVDDDGAFAVSWTVSLSPGVGYEVERATNVAFTVGKETVYNGSALNATTLAVVTTPDVQTPYYIRVRATKAAYEPSPWKVAAAPCNVGTMKAPPVITVPARIMGGSLDLYWTVWGSPVLTTYTVEEATSADFSSGRRVVYNGIQLNVSLNGLTEGMVYYYRVRANPTGWAPTAWTAGGNGCQYGWVQPPASISIPSVDADGVFPVTWGASPTPGVAYEAEWTRDSNFTSVPKGSYSGTALATTTTNLGSLDPGWQNEYWVRARATKAGWEPSEWRIVNYPCGVGAYAPPTTLTVPATDADGSYAVSWTSEMQEGVIYTLEETTDAAFTTGRRTVYSGTAKSCAVTGRSPWQTYYYRVNTSLSGYAPSGWTVAANPSKVGAPLAPASFTVPALDDNGAMTLKWAAVSTPDVSYVVEFDAMPDFTMEPIQIYSGLATAMSTNPVLMTPDAFMATYYYRVRAIREGFAPGPWKVGAPCKVGTPVRPTDLQVPVADIDGNMVYQPTYTVSWNPSPTPTVTYTLEEATSADFSSGKRTAYTGTATSAVIGARTKGVAYYYRVRSNKVGWTSSVWVYGENNRPCYVSPAPPASVTLPALDDDGAFVVKWTASPTPGVEYTVQRSTLADFGTPEFVYAGPALTATTSADGVNAAGVQQSYYVRVRASKVGFASPGPWRVAAAPCKVGTPELPEGAMDLSTYDADGRYQVSWAPSATAGVTYTLEEATNEAFTAGKRVAYSGPATTANITARAQGMTYFYRLRVNKTGWASSAWMDPAMCGYCNVGSPLPPTAITVPASDADGSYTITWLASPTPGVLYYELEESTTADFSNHLTLDPGLALSYAVTGREAGVIYYYRVRSNKGEFFPEATWRTGTVGCKVGSLAVPTDLMVPSTDPDGNYSVNWADSPTPGVSYELQEANNNTFTLGLRTIAAGAATTVDIAGRTLGKTYYYRVRAIKTGFTATAWVNTAYSCQVEAP